MPNAADKVKAWLWPAFIVLIGTILIFDIPHGRAEFCNSDTNCFLDWMGALSGWMGAAIALLVGLPTLKNIERQLDMLNRQTANITQTEQPYAYALHDLKSAHYIDITLVNLNRAPILVHSFRLDGIGNQNMTLFFPNGEIQNVDGQKLESLDFRDGDTITFKRPVYVDGCQPGEQVKSIKCGLSPIENINQRLDFVAEQVKITIEYECLGDPVKRSMTVPINSVVRGN